MADRKTENCGNIESSDTHEEEMKNSTGDMKKAVMINENEVTESKASVETYTESNGHSDSKVVKADTVRDDKAGMQSETLDSDNKQVPYTTSHNESYGENKQTDEANLTTSEMNELLAEHSTSLKKTIALEETIKRNDGIDKSVESVSELESNIAHLFQSMNDVMTTYSDRLDFETLNNFTENIGQFRGDLASIKDANLWCSNLAVRIHRKLTDLRQLTDNVKSYIDEKLKIEDLSTWVDETSALKSEKETLLEESILAEGIALVKASDARTAMATAAVDLEGARLVLAETEAQSAEAEVAARKAYQLAHEAVIAAQEARDAADKKRMAEEFEAMRRADERARQKAEAELKKQQEEKRIHEDAMKKGTNDDQERKLLEKEKLRKEEERRNPKNWHKYIYNVEGNEFDAGIGCILRAVTTNSEMREDDVQCLLVETSGSSTPLASDEELISNIIQLTETCDNNKLKFDEPFSIAIPHCINKVPAGKEAAVKMLTKNSLWVDLPTTEFVYEDNRDVKLAEARVTQLGTFAVVLRLRKDTLQLTRKGNKATCSLDPRITFTCKPGTVKQTFNFTLDVLPVDPTAISDLRAREPTDCNGLIMSSHFVRLSTAPGKTSKPPRLSKPLTVTVPLPQSIAKQRKSADKQASKSAPRPTSTRTPATTDEVQEELHFLYKVDKSGWIKKPDIEVIQTKSKDVVAFDTNELVDRFILLRTKRELRQSTVEKMATLLDRAMSQRYVRLHLRQQSRNPHSIVIACASSNRTEEVGKYLSQQGYQDEPRPSSEIVLEEGETLFVRFRGNIKCETEYGELVFIYNTHLRNEVSFRVKEVDSFAQNGLTCYRGFAQVLKKTMVPKPTHEDGRRQSRVEMVQADVLLAEMLVELPKPERDMPTPVYTVPVNFVEGPITVSVLRNLATGLGAEWKDVAAQLNIKPTRIQAILRQNVNQETAQTRYDMLVAWLKRMPKSLDKHAAQHLQIHVLHHVLLSAARPDLAEEIRCLGDEFRKQRLVNARASHLNKAFVKVAKTRSVFDNWQTFAKRLGLSDEAITRIEASSGSNQEKCFASLEQWKNSAGEQATIPALSAELKVTRNYSLSSEVESILTG